MRWQDIDQQPCSLARSLAIIGDNWTLLVLRDCFLGVRRFDDFQQRLGVTRHVLSDRLRKLADGGVLEKVAYQERPLRHEYRLTPMGRDLYPVIAHLAQWGDKYLAGDAGPPLVRVHRQCGEPLEAKLQCGHCGDSVEAQDIRLEENPHWAGQLLPTQAG
ncbi:helix-turn-helix domain-containing protein [Alcanivorax sp.]|jgi:DNA-binding HxlR family transcriptional regulator|uniref:winged helix-turn-helix transcriptional regulator n=1 Tax=Alcanivorax sp. TaxID=1872427 RepID=UPI0025BDCD7D|nr:helix-turn-helix domain-containing protein [Alcanivorax sp.]